MGKKNNQSAEKQAEQRQSTVFVSNLPYSFTTPQLEETFSEVGPIRRCFMVSQKGSTEHRGFGFVHFAVSEDADRAIEMKNGSSVGGRKIAVKAANPRASMEQRRAKANNVAQSTESEVSKNEKDGVAPEKHKELVEDHKDSLKKHKEVVKDHIEVKKDQKAAVKDHEVVIKDHKQGKPSAPKKAKGICSDLADAENHSGKQRVARTVIIGGLLNSDMSEDALSCAKEIDGVCSIKYPLPTEEVEQLGLVLDGCKLEAAAVLYASVRSARIAVTKLHQKEIKGGNIWARQLGGEGSKTQKWKLIVHNLPFKATEDEVREKFSSAGFVWDVSIPRNPETGLSKGFAFVKFTSKQDAERAIQKVNGQKFHKRTVSVDWVVPKKLYATGANSDVMPEEGKRVESAADSGSDSDGSSEDDDTQKIDEDSRGSDTSPDDAGIVENKASDTAADFEEEAKVSQKVLQSLMKASNKTSSPTESHSNLPHKAPDSEKSNDVPNIKVDGSLKQLSQSKPEKTTENKVTKSKLTEEDGELQKTIFISNIPFDIDAEEVKQRFSSFGEVQSFFPVLHRVTGRPRGTGFLKFRNTDAVSAAVSAAKAGPGLGIFMKGRQLMVLKALDKKSANEIVVEKSKNEERDRRNLYLTKEGLILEGTPAAEGVSATDLEKRKNLERKKTVKLQSPNFHVSRNRLIIYNIPKSMNVNEFKKLVMDAVTSRAVKKTPTIQQIKFLKDSKRGKVVSKNHSRGVAFVEFTEHEHALVALRVLNNNPETFGPQHRPIVEFALDNIQTLRQRNMKIQAQQQETTANSEAGIVDEQEAEELPDSSIEQNNKSKKRKSHDKKSGAALDGEDDRGTSKKLRRNDPKKKLKHIEEEQTQERKKPSNTKPQEPKSLNKNSKRNHAKPVEEEQTQERKKLSNAKPQEPKTLNKSMKRKDREAGSDVKEKRVRTGKNKDPVGRDMVDKLDLLIQQYRSKFSQRGSDKANNGEKQSAGSKKIRRWFQ